MTFAFVSNYINHHQKPFCDAMYKLLGNDFVFVQTMPMESDRIAMGWDDTLVRLPYVRLLYEDEASCIKYIEDCDIVLFGWSGREDIAQNRLLSGRPTMRVSERIYRDGRYKAISPRGLIAKYKEHIRFRNKPVYMLCAGAYTAADFALIQAYPGKCLKWGYYPPMRIYDEHALQTLKGRKLVYESGEFVNTENDDPGIRYINIVWAGRLIYLKHPEYAVRLIAALKKKISAKNAVIRLHMIGSGELESELKELAGNLGVSDSITWYGFMNPDEVRDVMEHCDIHLCTSNQLEGWGAVVNEGMNSGCIEIVSDRMGAVPFLIQDGINGITYAHDSYDELEEKAVHVTESLLCDVDTEASLRIKKMGGLAYDTITNLWNADVAAGRLVDMAKELVRAYKSEEEPNVLLPEDGPLSKAYRLNLNGACEGKVGHLE